ncbi:hypothetical protein Tco_0454245 [Tanacetum coccineum]
MTGIYPKESIGKPSAPRRFTRLTLPAPVPTVVMVGQESENVIDDSPIPRSVDQNIPDTRLEPRSDKESPEVEITNVGRYGYLFEHLRAKFLLRKPFDTLADHLQEVMVASLPTMERGRLQAEISSQIQQAIDNKMPSLVDASVHQTFLFELLPFAQEIRTTLMMMLLLDNSAKRQKASEYKAHVTGESSEQVNEREQSLSSLEVSLTINEAKLKKIADEMLRQRCTSGDEHQYHIDQMKNFLKSTIVWESRKEILASPHPRKTTPLVQSSPSPEIVARRANECIVSITESDYKNLNKNDIEDMYLLIMNGKDFQDSLDDEEDTRSSHEYLNDLEEEYQARSF